MGVTHAVRRDALEVVASRIQDVEVVLDLGPGICPQPVVKPQVHISVDAHRPYLERVKKESADDPKFVLINSPWEQAITGPLGHGWRLLADPPLGLGPGRLRRAVGLCDFSRLPRA